MRRVHFPCNSREGFLRACEKRSSCVCVAVTSSNQLQSASGGCPLNDTLVSHPSSWPLSTMALLSPGAQVAAFAMGRGPLAMQQCKWTQNLLQFGAVLSLPVIPRDGE